MANWRFNPKEKINTVEDPTNNQFFSNETVGNLSNALIREGIQNNMDEAKDDKKPVRVRIFLSGTKYALNPKVYEKYIKELLPHLNAENNGIIKSELPDFSKPMKFVVFEDFNTKGLEGNPLEYNYADTRDKTKPHNFYFFWRAYGISGKLGGNKMGSWGVGKSVFPASSLINSFWGITVRESDKKAYLIGQSVLKTHNIADNPAECGYSPYGNYGKFEGDGFSIPEDSVKLIAEIAKDFKVSRTFNEDEKMRENDTGLSIIIPFPKDDLTIDNLLYSTIQQFFYPLILGRLSVEIVCEDLVYNLDKDNIQNELNRIDFNKVSTKAGDIKINLLSLFAFTRWILNLKDEDYIKLSFKNVQTAYEWRKKELFGEINIESLQTKFDKGDPIAFKIPVKFQPEGKNAEIRYFTAYIQRDENLQEPENYFIREYLNIIGVKSLRKKGVRGMVLLSDKDLVTFFGQAEGPAHTGWHKDNFRTKYESVEQCISFVQNSLDRLYSILLRPSEGLDKNLLQEFFYVEDLNELNTYAPKDAPGNKKTSPEILIPVPKPKPYLIEQIIGGFRIYNNPKSTVNERELSVRVAYDRFDGNPFNKHSEFDFNLRDLRIESSRIDNLKLDKNTIMFEPAEGTYEIKITGFDTKRDLIIDVK